MITRSKRDASYEHIELPDKKRKRQKREKQEPEPESMVEQEQVKEDEDVSYLQQPPYEEPNITISYYERQQPLYEVNIDFDEAHNQWVKNKVKLQNGCYRYKKERKGKLQK